MHYRIPFLLTGIFVSVLALAQDRPEVTFGQVTDADRTLLSAPGDSTAEAYVLYDRLSLDFEYSDSDGPTLAERIHRRVKLLTPAGFERANVSIEYDTRYESIGDVEAAIHLPTGGTILVFPKDIINEAVTTDRSVVKFTFPQVTEGAIIEYRYIHRDKNILQPTPYRFQEDIPVRWAQYDAIIPPYYSYVYLGNAKLTVNEMKITKREWGPVYTAGAYANDRRIEHNDICWAMRDIPAYVSQPYVNNFVDHLPGIRLQLQSVQYPVGGKRSIFGNWEETVKELQDRKDFGRYYRNKINFNQVYKAFEAELKGLTTPAEIVGAAYAFVNRNLSWNGDYEWLASDAPNRIFAAGSGNSADLNILLLALLNEAGVEAHPLLVSLRNTGKPIEDYPLLHQFNHLMVYAVLPDGPILLDADGSSRAAGLPRERALNHRGWVADEDNPRWVDMDVPSARQTVMVKLKVDEAGQGEAEITARMDSYFAASGRSSLSQSSSKQDAPLASTIIKAFPAAQVADYEVLTEDERSPVIDYRMHLQVPAGQAMDDYLYLQPILLPLLDSELDDVQQRSMPIDFPFPWRQQYVANISVPEGYVLEDHPQPMKLRTQDGGMQAVYAVAQNPSGDITVSYTVDLSRTVYPAEEYPALRDIFQRIIELQQSPLVLKRAK